MVAALLAERLLLALGPVFEPSQQLFFIKNIKLVLTVEKTKINKNMPRMDYLKQKRDWGCSILEQFFEWAIPSLFFLLYSLFNI